jgi:HK97 family phage portal protein
MALFSRDTRTAEDVQFEKDLEKYGMTKLNPAQEEIASAEGTSVVTTKHPYKFAQAYKDIEVVRRGVDLIIDSASAIKYDVKEKLGFTGLAGSIKQKKIALLLNSRPNPYQDINAFRSSIFMDMLMDGNAFLYFDGEFLFVLPASRVEIIPHKKTFVDSYMYDGKVKYTYNEIIHIKDNSASSIYRGDSRLRASIKSINILNSMLDYQENFFNNGAVPGLVLKTKDVLSQRIKDRMVAVWTQKYNPKSGGRKPVILDGGLELDSINPGNFQELDFSSGVTTHEERILKALGVPPVLLNSGNNANISPNLKLFYNVTVIPLVNKYVAALEAFFTYDIKEDISEVKVLRPELKDEAAYYSGLVNNGIMTGAEARKALRLPELPDMPELTEIRIPANIAGSATGVSGQEGGKPATEDEGV